jgi:hypothetical protein
MGIIFLESFKFGEFFAYCCAAYAVRFTSFLYTIRKWSKPDRVKNSPKKFGEFFAYCLATGRRPPE